MKSQECREQRLAEYVDGELSGIEMLHVSRHLEQCATCGQEAQDLRRMGDMLRHAAHPEAAPSVLAGLASSVVSRVGAERAQSWRALFSRAVEDWHWFLVGFGSVTAAFISIAFVSAVLHFGPAPERQDSVAALLSNPDWHVVKSEDGSMWVWATPSIKPSEYRILLTSRERAEAVEAAKAAPYLTKLSEEQVVGALGDALTGSGKPIDLQSMTPGIRNHAIALINRLRNNLQQDGDRPIPNGGTPQGDRGTVYRMQFVTNTEVTAKGL
jgi:hypothetical protein